MSKLIVAVLSLLVLAGTAAAGPITVEEFMIPEGIQGHYELTNDSTDLYVVGFAVVNDYADTVNAFRSGWAATKILSNQWDAGYWFLPLSTLFLNTADFGTFDELFGEEHFQVILYRAEYVASGLIIGPGVMEDRFVFSTYAELASPSYVVFLSDGSMLGPIDPQAIIPEPGSLALVGLGLAGLGLAIRRKLRKAG